MTDEQDVACDWCGELAEFTYVLPSQPNITHQVCKKHGEKAKDIMKGTGIDLELVPWKASEQLKKSKRP